MKLITALTLLGVVTDRATVALAKGPSFGRPRPIGRPFSMEDALAMDAAAGAGTVDRRQSDKYGTEAFFDQLIDHKNPSLGTFKQRYWYNAKHYAGAGSPIIMYNAGESDAKVFTGYLSNWTMSGLLAQNVGGAAIVLEHRYWGKSSPYSVLTIANLTHLNVDNAIADMTRFAREVELPFAPKAATDPAKAPWVLFGTSYSGALAAWTERVDPGVFWAYYGSSATIHSIRNFWHYFRPVQLGMPRNCSTDVNRVLAKIDSILLNGTAGDRTALKTRFGLQTIEDLDFADALAKGPYQWQYTDYSTGYGDFYQWCDYVENAHPKAYPNATAPGPDGVGADKALEGYARWVKEVLIPRTCDSDDMVDCFGHLDPNNTWYTNFTVSWLNGSRQWQWLKCNEPLEGWPNGAPEGYPTLHSRLIQMPYVEEGCRLMFREQKVGDKVYTYGMARGVTADDLNRRMLGGFAYAKPTRRLLYVNGEFDPWLDETVSSVLRPGGPMRSTDAQPVLILPGGSHATDMLAYMGDYNAGARKVQEQAMATMVKWVKEHPSMKGR